MANSPVRYRSHKALARSKHESKAIYIKGATIPVDLAWYCTGVEAGLQKDDAAR